MLLRKDCAHLEKSGSGRAIIHRITCGKEGEHGMWWGGELLPDYKNAHDPWLLDRVEEFPELGGMKQRVQIGEFADFGRGLVIDGMSQLSEKADEIYTPALIVPAAMSVQQPTRWLIAGGGDGAAAREVLRFIDTERVVLVDLSRTVIEGTQKLIPKFWDGCENDQRLEIKSVDIFKWLQESSEMFDVVVCDLTDPEDPEYTPFGASTADHVYTEEAFRLFAEHLASGGVFVMQAQELSSIRWAAHLKVRRTLGKVFRRVWSYRVYVEMFGYWESFLIASMDQDPPIDTTAHELQWRLEELTSSVFIREHFNAWMFHAMFALPSSLHRKLGVASS